MKFAPPSKHLGLALLCAFLGVMSLQAQVVGYWQFNEKAPGNVSDTTTGAILDSSGNGNNGTTTLPLNYIEGNATYGSGSAFTFVSGNVDVPDPSGVFNFSPSQSMTFEAMVRTYTMGPDTIGAIVCKQGANPGEWWWRINANGTQQFWIDDGQGEKHNVSGGKVLNDNQWHHIAAIYDAAAQQLRVYADGALDGIASAVFTTSGTIGNAENLSIGKFQNGTRQLNGDIDFVRVSQGALDPVSFVQPETYIANLTPTNGSIFLPADTTASFSVISPNVGVAATNITVTINGTDISSQLTISGSANDYTVTMPALTENQYYNALVSVKDLNGITVTQSWIFNTFANDVFSIEGEDYNFGGGQFIDNPQLSSSDGPNNYLDQLGVEGIDFHQTNTATLTQYRIGDLVGTAVAQDTLRQAYLDAQVNDPYVTDYMVRDNADNEWLDYTRTFPTGTYRIYARVAKPGTVPVVMSLDEVTSGSTTTTQTTSPIGTFWSQPTGSAASYQFVPLTDALGNAVGVSLSGVRTLRLTFVSGGGNVNLNYFVFVPVSSSQAPFVAAASPSAGAGNATSNATVQVSIRNADTSINTGTVQLALDGSAQAPSVSSTTDGATITCAPTTMAIGSHTATLIFTDSNSTTVTNQWQFYVANQSVRGYWKFNERTNSVASTNSGAILDASGNNRNGTASGSIAYVGGSFNYGNSQALHFTTGPDRVVVPDVTGNFIFTNSFTFEAVVRTTNYTTTTGAILAKNGTGDGEGEFWWRLPGLTGGVQRVGLNNQLFINGTNALNDGLWHHIAMVYDQSNSQVRLYADYKLEAIATNYTPTMPIGRPADLSIGGFNGGGGSDFDGDIDLIRISNGALDPTNFVQTSVALQPIVKTLLPANGAQNVSPTATISAEFQNRDTSVVLGSMKLYVDGSDVTSDTQTSSPSTNTAKISYIPASPLADGSHLATVVFSDSAVPANFWTNSWSFTNISSIPVLGFYQFNEKPPGNFADTNAGAILDDSGSGRNGTAVSFMGMPYVAGSTNYGSTSALEFSVANTNEVDVPDPSGAFNWHPNQSVTLEAVIRTTAIGQSSVGCIMAKQLLATPEWWWRINANGTQQFDVNDSSGAKSVSGKTVLNDGNWHHLAVIYDGQSKQLRAYVDYVQDGSTVTVPFTSTTSTIGSAEDLYIGRFQAGNRIFEGDMDMVRITGAALDPSWFLSTGNVSVATPVTLTDIVNHGSNSSFSFATQVAHSYVIQATSALGSPWTNIQTNSGDGTIQSFSFPIITGTNEFFRLMIQ